MFYLIFNIFLSALSAYGGSLLPIDAPIVRFSLDPLYHEQGYRMGSVLSFAKDIFGNYEGELLLGIGSSPATIVDRSCIGEDTPKAPSQAPSDTKQSCVVDHNPWDFSSVDGSIFRKFNASGPGPVVVYYNKEASRTGEFLATGAVDALWTSTRNYVSKIWSVSDKIVLPSEYPAHDPGMPWSDKLNYDTFSTEGRVVKATMDGTYLKTYEITVQESNFGSNFKRLSVTDSGMFDYLVATMFSGRPVRFHCVNPVVSGWQRLFPGYTTPFRVLRVQIL